MIKNFKSMDNTKEKEENGKRGIDLNNGKIKDLKLIPVSDLFSMNKELGK